MDQTELMKLVEAAAEKSTQSRELERGFLGMSLSRLDSLARFDAERTVRELLAQPRYEDPKRLERHGFRAFSQNDEDGIIQEIFRRIGTTNRTFFEFGSGNGLESNCCYLLFQGWKGMWADAEDKYLDRARAMFAPRLATGQLRVERGVITAENVNDVMYTNDLDELDLLSIDVDGNDYYIFEALVYQPRVLVIEYNALFPPPVKLVQKHEPLGRWDDTSYFGASLSALHALALSKGYTLVGTNLAGVNAFFVRKDCAANPCGDPGCSPDCRKNNLFAAEATAENHYHPPRFKLGEFGYPTGHRSNVGPYVVLP